MKKAVVLLSVFGALAWSGRVLAHEGHSHKVMGTLTAVDATHIEILTPDGKKESLPLTKETKYFKGKTPAAAADLKVGSRVVLSVVEEDDKKSITEVFLGDSDKGRGSKEHVH